jgi:CBS domain-containing protein
MKVREAMVRPPVFCSLQTNLGGAVEIMWKRNCGFLPIVDAQRRVVGVITDRDIAIAMGTRNRLPAEITVAEALRERCIHASQQMMSVGRST